MQTSDHKPARPNFLRREPGLLESFCNVCYKFAGIFNAARGASHEGKEVPYKVPTPAELNHK